MAGFTNRSARYLSASAPVTLSFEWTGSHNVYSLPDWKAFENCDFSGAHFLGDKSPTTYKTPNKFQSQYFACKKPGHCVHGQKLAVTGDIIF